jgi:class 3 adenylate cyclase
VNCLSCGEELPERAGFCFVCGTQVAPRSCASCGEELPPRAAFCFACGTPVGRAAAKSSGGAPAPALAERRLTSVLFVDLVSYTTLSESRDTEDVRSLLDQYFSVCKTVIGRYGGTVEKFIGDAVMAVWGVPVAHEDDAERAVRAALELVGSVAALGERVGLPGLAARAGVVTGEVTANLAATDQGMVAGDPVNTAARVQAAAGAGQVWVDAATRHLTVAAVTYSDEGLHALKGKSDRVHLFRAGTVVAAVGGEQRVDGLEAPLAGRDRELRLLKEHFHATEESGRPRLVVLDGEAGSGKTRLAWEFFKYVDGLKTPVSWNRGRCLSYGDGVAFWALAEAVRARVGLVEDQHEQAVLDAIDRQLLESVPDEEERAWLRPRVASLLGEESREFARDDLFAAWTRFLERISEGDPLVLLVDDAQYADDGLVDFVDSLLTNSHHPMFVLLLARPELLELRPQLGGRRASVVRLEPLPDPAMARLVDGLVDGLDHEVRDELVRRSAGVPLYAVETVRALIDRDLVQPSGGRYVVNPDQPIDLEAVGAPASLHALVAARLDGLDPVERRVVGDASVLGESFTREGIGVLAGDVPDLDEVLDVLKRKELIATDSDRFSAERGQFRFVQSVVRQVAYSTLSKRDRKDRHLLVAEHPARDTERADELAQVVAQHLFDAADASSADDDADAADLRSRGAELLLRAGERAWALSSYADSLRTCDAALAALPGEALEPRARALMLRTRALQRLTRYDDTIEAARAAMAAFDELGDAGAAATAAYELSMAVAATGRNEESLEIARQRYDSLAGCPGVDHPRGRLALAISGSLQFLGRFDEVAGPLHEALRVSDRVDDFELRRSAFNLLALFQAVVGSRRVSRLLYDDIAAEARKREDWQALGLALGNTSILVAPIDLARATELGQEAISCKTDHGIPADPLAHMNLNNFLGLGGRWDELPAAQESLREYADVLGASALVARATEMLCGWAGRPAPAEGSTPPAEVGGVFEVIDHYCRATEALAAGDLARALDLATEAARLELHYSDITDDFHVYWPLAVRIALLADDRAVGAELMRYVDERNEALVGSIAANARVFRALWEARAGAADPLGVEADLLAGIEGLERSGAVVWRAHAQEDLGRFLLEQGRAEDAEPHLEAARQTYAELGATSWLARLDWLVPTVGGAVR